MDKRVVETNSGSDPVKLNRLIPRSIKDLTMSDMNPEMDFENFDSFFECSCPFHDLAVDERLPRSD
eukprot:scaffold243042_cov14-Tisochrysis_lutea.AAC.1